MCCFSAPVTAVSATNIFARPGTGSSQYLVYSMHLSTRTDVAMILPIPVAQPAEDDALTFISLEMYAEFFDDMNRGFPMPQPRSIAAAGSGPIAASAPLVVKAVGSFEASFVPSIADFDRLDSRFRLPDQTWEQLPQYKSYGFAVFKLKPGAKTIHPMAFKFPRAEPSRLFFPTVHIHDGKVHATADFDHSLFCQREESAAPCAPQWMESPRRAASFMTAAKSRGIIDPHSHCYLRKIQGRNKNEDILL